MSGNPIVSGNSTLSRVTSVAIFVEAVKRIRIKENVALELGELSGLLFYPIRCTLVRKSEMDFICAHKWKIGASSPYSEEVEYNQVREKTRSDSEALLLKTAAEAENVHRYAIEAWDIMEKHKKNLTLKLDIKVQLDAETLLKPEPVQLNKYYKPLKWYQYVEP